MAVTECTATAGTVIAPCESIASIQLNELVKGQDRTLMECLGPLVHRQSIALDLASVRRIDAAGIGALITLYATASQAGHSFRVVNSTPRVEQILALVGLDRFLLSQMRS